MMLPSGRPTQDFRVRLPQRGIRYCTDRGSETLRIYFWVHTPYSGTSQRGIFHVRKIGPDFFRKITAWRGQTHPVIILQSLMLSSILVFCAVVMVAGPGFYALSPRQVPNLKPYLRRLRAALE
jgi:hypothetical protein